MATNRLINTDSPYLLQHAHNPVDWYPWGDEAFATARSENKPIFLSIGYATCHWCHVMERESFEDDQVAQLLNTNFIAIKVDREERPDIDAVYMTACQLVTGSGGWPLTIVMDHAKRPFFAATYLPKSSNFGRLGLVELLSRVTELWRDSPDRIAASGREIVGHIQNHFNFGHEQTSFADERFLKQTLQDIAGRFDTQFGGFESAPKFPMPHRLLFLLNGHDHFADASLLSMTHQTLIAMRQGGIWDHVGFGFHRYATDRQWLLPHFEKMLYDQALLAMAYLEGFRLTGDALLSGTVRDIFTYVLTEMTDEKGGFYTAQDADSEGVEGKFYIWSQTEFQQLSQSIDPNLPWNDIFNMTSDGNFMDEATRQKTGENILYLTRTPVQWADQLGIAEDEFTHRWQQVRQKLFDVRKQREHPLKDDKILTDWNGLMIAALAKGARMLDHAPYLTAAKSAADFIFNHLVDENGRLYHRYRRGRAGISATANDYAYLIMGLLELAESEPDGPWGAKAEALQQTMNDLFRDPLNDGFYLADRLCSDLPVRPRELYDGALPSANSVALNNLIDLGRHTHDSRWLDQARSLMTAIGATVKATPQGYLHSLNGWFRLPENLSG